MKYILNDDGVWRGYLKPEMVDGKWKEMASKEEVEKYFEENPRPQLIARKASDFYNNSNRYSYSVSYLPTAIISISAAALTLLVLKLLQLLSLWG